jgi:hypothetical protein
VPDSDFSCDYCVRVGFSRRTPKADDDGVSLSASAVLELYNERRYQHYLDDFNDELDLARHLNDRTNHFAETGTDDEKSSTKAVGFASNAVTLAWWKRAQLRDPDAAEVAQRADFQPAPAEVESWAKLVPAQRFARLKKQVRETFDGRHEVPQITVEDNARQIPTELTMEEMQERDRQLGRLESWELAE